MYDVHGCNLSTEETGSSLKYMASLCVARMQKTNKKGLERWLLSTGAGVWFTAPQWSSQPSVTLVPGYATPFFDLCEYCTCMWCTYINAGKIFTHIKSNLELIYFSVSSTWKIAQLVVFVRHAWGLEFSSQQLHKEPVVVTHISNLSMRETSLGLDLSLISKLQVPYKTLFQKIR